MSRVRLLCVLLLAGVVTACDLGNGPNRSVIWTGVAASNGYTCGLMSSGAAYCWGGNSAGQLGDGSTDSAAGYRHLTPVAVVGGGLTFASLTAGGGHTCGVTFSGVAYCWGSGGSVGVADTANGPPPNHTAPVAVAGGLTFASLTAGLGHTCGVTSAGAASCWGYNAYGQLGDGSLYVWRWTPVAVAGGLTFAGLTAGSDHTCGLTSSGAAYCWGLVGALGDGQTHTICYGHMMFPDAPCALAPSAVAGGLTFSTLAAGYDHTCGLTSSGAAYCWGDDYWGELGDDSAGRFVRPTPVAVAGGLTFARLTAGQNFTCGLTGSGVAYCWGRNSNGQLGDGSTTQHATPVAVAGGLTFTSLGAGWTHTCGVTSRGAVYCWGDNAQGELGDSTTVNRLAPVAVVNP